MTKLGTIALTDHKGHHYEFIAYAWGTHFKEKHGGVYFVTARHDQELSHHSHHKIYVGETEDLSSEFDNHPLDADFKAHKANCICVHASQNKKARQELVEEMINQYNPPCNL